MMYRVIWEIDLDAEDPRQAARLARALQLSPDSLATFFQVLDPDNKQTNVDLLAEQRNQDDDRETLAPGDARYYRPPGVSDR